MEITGRTDTMDMEQIDLCEHISIEMKKVDPYSDEAESEFTASLDIKCDLCDITHDVTILIN